MESGDSYLAKWMVSYPIRCDVAGAWGVLDACLICNGSWDHFIWDLEALYRLLTERPASYDYLYVTRFLKARAAELAMNGPFASNQVTVLSGLARLRLQFAGIYRFLFLFALEQALSKSAVSAGRGLNDVRLFRVDIGMIEQTYLNILEVISLMPDPEMFVQGYRIGDWIAGRLRAEGQSTAELVPASVPVAVDIEEMGWYRKVKPAKPELAIKLLKHDRIRCFRELTGTETACDRELERLCARRKLGGEYPFILCGDEMIEYYGMTTNNEKDTLYVVCADCTMRLKQAGESVPGSRPAVIYPGWSPAERPSCSLDREVAYLVEFTDGVTDVFCVSFRAHRENEKPDVPRSLWGKAGGGSGTWSAGRVSPGTGLRLGSGREGSSDGKGGKERAVNREAARSESVPYRETACSENPPYLAACSESVPYRGTACSESGPYLSACSESVPYRGAACSENPPYLAARSESGPYREAACSENPPYHSARSESEVGPHGARALDGGGADAAADAGVKIVGDYRLIRFPGGPDLNLGRKHKARAVLRFVCEELMASGTDCFYVEEVRERFNAQFSKGALGRQWRSDRFREDLFRGCLGAFDRLFETRDKAAGIYRLTILDAVRQRDRAAD